MKPPFIGPALGPETGCTRAPKGWYCVRYYKHDGPCAAWPTAFTRMKYRLRGRTLPYRKIGI